MLIGAIPKITLEATEINVEKDRDEYTNVDLTPTTALRLLKTKINNGSLANIELFRTYIKTSGKAFGNTTVNIDMEYPGVMTPVSFPVNVGYPVYVAGTLVHPGNAGSIKGKGIREGSVSYNWNTKKMTLNGATLSGTYPSEGDNDNVILSRTPLNIELIGNNSISSYGRNGNLNGVLAYNGALSIGGEGSLSINMGTTSGETYGLNCNDGVTVNYGNITISNIDYGIISSLNSVVINGGTVDILTNKAALLCGKDKYITIYDALINEGDTSPGIEVTKLTINDSKSKKYVHIRPKGSGLASLTSQGIHVWGGKGVIHITPAELVEVKTVHVYNVSGALIRTLPIGYGDMLVTNIPAGIYMVRIGNAAEKVVVY